MTNDIDQLPSVGPGQVLANVIGSAAVPVVRLTEKAAASRALRADQAVSGGSIGAALAPRRHCRRKTAVSPPRCARARRCISGANSSVRPASVQQGVRDRALPVSGPQGERAGPSESIRATVPQRPARHNGT
jgi:hypothetical protein